MASARTVTVHIAVEATVEGDVGAGEAAQHIMLAFDLPDEVHIGSAAVAYPRAMGLLRFDERTVNPDEWGG